MTICGLRKRKVIAVIPSGVKPVRRLRTALGHTIIATAEHPFLTLEGWRQLGALRVGQSHRRSTLATCQGPPAMATV